MHAGTTTSIWMDTAKVPSFPRLTEDTKADLCVIGAGITGLTTAYCAARQGLSVILIDDGAIGGGETERTTAHISNALDDRYYELASTHGKDGARIAADSHTAAIEWIERTIQREGIECDFRRLEGYLFCPPGESTKILEDEEAATREAGIAVDMLPRAPLGSFDTGKCLRFPRQAVFHPLLYLSGLARAAREAGVRIFTDTHADAVEGGPPAKTIVSGGHTITTDFLVVATNAPINDSFALYTRQSAYRTYVVAFAVPRGSVHDALYWDTADPYHYVRLQPGDAHDVLIVGGEDHKTGQATDMPLRYHRLEEWAKARFPQAKTIAWRWSGQVMEPIDGLAFIGRNPLDKNTVFIATGDSGNGMTHGTIAGILLTDLLFGRNNPWASLYDPLRIRAKAFPEAAKENLNVALRYTEIARSAPEKEIETIKPGHGAVIQDDKEKLAVFRDEKGTVHRMSAICPHKGCVVHWNPDEKSWDCPCHGSRFSAQGTVINGPSIADLKRLTAPKTEPAAPRRSTPGKGS